MLQGDYKREKRASEDQSEYAKPSGNIENNINF